MSKIINGHKCILHVPDFPNHKHKIVKILRTIMLFNGHTKNDIRNLASIVLDKRPYHPKALYPDYAFTELHRNGYINKTRYHNNEYFYTISPIGRDFLLKADVNDLNAFDKLK